MCGFYSVYMSHVLFKRDEESGVCDRRLTLLFRYSVSVLETGLVIIASIGIYLCKSSKRGVLMCVWKC
jgi:hypothetical protein